MFNGRETYSILRLKEKDAAELVLLERECFSSGWNEKQYRGLLQPSQGVDKSASLPFLAFGIRGNTGKLAAYISLATDHFEGTIEILNIGVHQSSRRAGLAWSLLRHSLDWGRETGLTRCLLEVREHNQPALNLYKKAGFQVLGRRKKYYHDTGEDALLMVLELQQWRTE